MAELYNLSGQESFIMKLLWASPTEMTLGAITELLQKEGFQPTIGTAKTYLTRLVKKGALKTRKAGHKLLYSPSCDEKSYEQQWAKNFLEDNFHGSLAAFICALNASDTLTPEQFQKLKDLYHE